VSPIITISLLKCSKCLWSILKANKLLNIRRLISLLNEYILNKFSLNNVFFLCPNPFKHPRIEKVYNIVSEYSKHICFMLNLNDLMHLKPSIIDVNDDIYLVCDNPNDLLNNEEHILALESHGFENINILFLVNKIVNSYDLENIINFCLIHGLQLKFIENLHRNSKINIMNLLLKMNVEIGDSNKSLFGCKICTIAVPLDI